MKRERYTITAATLARVLDNVIDNDDRAAMNAEIDALDAITPATPDRMRVDVDILLERFDRTDPHLQRLIVATFAARMTHYEDALREIQNMPEVQLDEAAQICRDTLDTRFDLIVAGKVIDSSESRLSK